MVIWPCSAGCHWSSNQLICKYLHQTIHAFQIADVFGAPVCYLLQNAEPHGLLQLGLVQAHSPQLLTLRHEEL